MTGDSSLGLPLIESIDLSDEDKKFVKASLWRNGATPPINTAEQYARYKRIAKELSRKHDPHILSSLSSSARLTVCCSPRSRRA
jgi:ParB-like chromosome segregation protein Spo0J